jgi:hypothetical protein
MATPMTARRGLEIAIGVIVIALLAGMATLVLFAPVDTRPWCSGALPPAPQYGPGCHDGPLPADWLFPAVPPALSVFLAVLVAGLLVAWLYLRKSGASGIAQR